MFADKYGLTKAVLLSRKTMTRRIVPKCKELDILRLWERNNGAISSGYEEKTQSCRIDYCPDQKRRISIDHLNLIPSYKVGEVVAVAQSYKDLIYTRGFPLSFTAKPGWNNKMFVRADLMPHQIRITNVRAERLQDISDDDCMREGIYNWKDAPDCPDGHKNSKIELFGYDGSWDGFQTPRKAFASLIDKVSGEWTWQSNPWVFVYEFELVK